MVIGYHVTFATYGFWLPNDPRGSNSDYVRAPHLRPFGEATKVNDRRSHANDPHDRALRASAKRALMWDPVVLSGRQAQAVGAAFAKQIATSGFRIHACAILPKHVHLVIGRHRYKVEQVVNLLKGAATRELLARKLFERESDERPIWGRNLRKVFLDQPAEVVGRIGYVRENPLKERKPEQHWSFVVPFVG